MASGDRLDARDIRVRSDGLFYAARHKFFNLFGAGARPRRDDHRLFWGNVRVLALGHMGVAVYTPNDRANQQDPGDLRVFHAKAGGVMSFADQFVIFGVNHGITSTLSPSAMSVAPEATTRSPNFNP